MISTETGVYLQFYDEGEHVDKELPPLGPFELLIIRHNRIIGDREQVEHDMLGMGSVERWLEAELELRRALGDEPGGVRRSHMRIRAPRGDIIVRFYDYGGDEPPKVPELGPFYSLTIGKREVRADDKLLAIRSTDMSPWTLTDQVRAGIAGINKADFSVFSLSARDPLSQSRAAATTAPAPVPASPPAPAPQTNTVPPAANPRPEPSMGQHGVPTQTTSSEFTERRKIQREIYVARALPQQDERLTPADVNLILRVDKLKQQELAQQLMVERLRREQHIDPAVALRAQAVESLPMRFQPPVKERVAAEPGEVEYVDESFTERLLAFLWAARVFLVTGLVVVALVAAYGYLQAPTSPLAGPKALAFAGMNERIQADSWSFVVQSVDRLPRLGSTPPSQGAYLIVHLTALRKSDAPPLDPSQFTLIDAAGGSVFALPTTSDLYVNTGLVWPTRYPLNSAVPGMLVFDVSPSARGLLLLIKPANVEVRLPD